MDNPPTIVVTGMGAVTPLGGTFTSTWQRLIQGDDAAGPITVFDTSGCRCRQAAEAVIPDWQDIPEKTRTRWSRAIMMAVPAASEALSQAGLIDQDGRSLLPVLPVAVSTTGGGMSLGEAFLRGLRQHQGPRLQTFRVCRYSAQQQVRDLQEALGFSGPALIVANACASGANAIGHATDLIRRGDATCVLTGGFEALTELIYVGFDCLQTMSTDRCRPFDRQRSGLMLGEAAAFMVLESEIHALKRGAQILAVLAGYGHGTDLHHLTQPHPDGLTQVRAMRTALDRAGLSPSDIAYVNAHGTGTTLNDVSECAAFSTVFDWHNNSSDVRVSSTKSAIGHTLGAAGAIEALIALQSLRTGHLPVQLNLLDPEPSIAPYLVRQPTHIRHATATMSVNLGFGGSNAALVFRPYTRAKAHRTTQPSAIATPSPDLVIAGMGAVSPAGCGVAAIMQNVTPPVTSITGLTGKVHRAMCVDLKTGRLAEWPLHPRVRRASPITIFMLEAAQQAIEQASRVNPDRLGIVATFGSGALVLSRKFFEGVLKNGQRFASPNLFPETVFNSPTSHLASVLGVQGPCYSLVGDESAWVTGLGVARGWLRDNLVDHVIVVGAEELDPIILDAFAAARWTRSNSGFIGAEGAGAVLLQRGAANGICAIDQLSEGWSFRTKQDGDLAARACADSFRGATRVWKTAQQTWWSHIESGLHADRGWIAPDPLPSCGQAFTASAAWHTIRASHRIRHGDPQPCIVPVFGLNMQCAAISLKPVDRSEATP